MVEEEEEEETAEAEVAAPAPVAAPVGGFRPRRPSACSSQPGEASDVGSGLLLGPGGAGFNPKCYVEELDRLKKENLSLRLRIYILEERKGLLPNRQGGKEIVDRVTSLAHISVHKVGALLSKISKCTKGWQLIIMERM